MDTTGQIDRYKIMAALERIFFEAYINGMNDGMATDGTRQDLTPKTIKQLAAAHYEQMVSEFHDTLFFPIARLNYTFEEIERRVREIAAEKATMVRLMQMACRTEEMFETMKTEYIRNVTDMLEGHFANAGEHLGRYTRGDGSATNDTVTAIQTLTAATVKAYALGVRAAGKGNGLNQTTLVSMLINAMTILLHDRPIDTALLDAAADINGQLLTVCRSEENMQAMMDSYQAAMSEIIASDI